MDRLWIILNSKKKIIGEQSAHTKKSRSFGGTKKIKNEMHRLLSGKWRVLFTIGRLAETPQSQKPMLVLCVS